MGRDATQAERDQIRSGWAQIPSLPSYEADERLVDTSLEVNRDIVIKRYTDVGIPPDVARAMWQLDCEPDAWPVYPDAPGVVSAIKDRGCKTALVSDFHVDLRSHLSAHGIELDAYVLSFEHGFQKPDARMFLTALDLLGVGPTDALMVGDRVTHDGGAAAVGIDTLLLPQPTPSGPRGLDVVLGIIG